jgi:hypothetical protein
MLIYRDVIRFTLMKQGHKLKKWPGNWLNLSVWIFRSKLTPHIRDIN